MLITRLSMHLRLSFVELTWEAAALELLVMWPIDLAQPSSGSCCLPCCIFLSLLLRFCSASQRPAALWQAVTRGDSPHGAESDGSGDSEEEQEPPPSRAARGSRSGAKPGASSSRRKSAAQEPGPPVEGALVRIDAWPSDAPDGQPLPRAVRPELMAHALLHAHMCDGCCHCSQQPLCTSLPGQPPSVQLLQKCMSRYTGQCPHCVRQHAGVRMRCCSDKCDRNS